MLRTVWWKLAHFSDDAMVVRLQLVQITLTRPVNRFWFLQHFKEFCALCFGISVSEWQKRMNGTCFKRDTYSLQNLLCHANCVQFLSSNSAAIPSWLVEQYCLPTLLRHIFIAKFVVPCQLCSVSFIKLCCHPIMVGWAVLFANTFEINKKMFSSLTVSVS